MTIIKKGREENITEKLETSIDDCYRRVLADLMFRQQEMQKEIDKLIRLENFLIIQIEEVKKEQKEEQELEQAIKLKEGEGGKELIEK